MKCNLDIVFYNRIPTKDFEGKMKNEKFRCCRFALSWKPQIRFYRVVVLRKWQGNVLKWVLFRSMESLYFGVLVAVAFAFALSPLNFVRTRMIMQEVITYPGIQGYICLLQHVTSSFQVIFLHFHQLVASKEIISLWFYHLSFPQQIISLIFNDFHFFHQLVPILFYNVHFSYLSLQSKSNIKWLPINAMLEVYSRILVLLRKLLSLLPVSVQCYAPTSEIPSPSFPTF